MQGDVSLPYGGAGSAFKLYYSPTFEKCFSRRKSLGCKARADRLTGSRKPSVNPESSDRLSLLEKPTKSYESLFSC